MVHSMRRVFVFFVVICASAQWGAGAQPSDELAARVMAAYGGREAWSKVTGFRETANVTSATRTGKMTRQWQRPDKLRVEVVYPTSTEVRVVDGDKGTQNGKEATGMGLAAMRLQAARLALPALLLVGDRHSCQSAQTGVSVPHCIEINLPDAMTLTVEVDSDGHIVRSTGKSTGIEFSTVYSDFRKVDGLLFAFREENFAQGAKTATNEITAIEVNPSR